MTDIYNQHEAAFARVSAYVVLDAPTQSTPNTLITQPRGAPMGRPCYMASNFASGATQTRPLHLTHVRLDRGGYDATGAYWGHGQRIYAIWDDGGLIYWTTRAKSRDAAKAEFRLDHPNAWFYGERKPKE